ncbi:MAG: hypothetical protein NUV94_06595 [Candidatus Acetothermia bacterium]|jgi:low affinity Fe/Cu permease|nr:hypothetical protein [Candidatus Acetothermia bacterium]
MHRLTGYIQSFLLAAGAALVGLVIGTLIKPPATAVTVILLAVGVVLLFTAILLGRRRG